MAAEGNQSYICVWILTRVVSYPILSGEGC